MFSSKDGGFDSENDNIGNSIDNEMSETANETENSTDIDVETDIEIKEPPNHEPKKQLLFVRVVDRICEATGIVCGACFFICMLILFYEVISRRFFNSPTVWAYDMGYIIGNAGAIFGIAYAFKQGAMIRVDLIYERFKPKTQAVMDMIFTVILFFPMIITGMWATGVSAMDSLLRFEKIMSGTWRPPIYPTKIMIFIAIVLLFLQGVVQFIRMYQKFKGEVRIDG